MSRHAPVGLLEQRRSSQLPEGVLEVFLCGGADPLGNFVLVGGRGARLAQVVRGDADDAFPAGGGQGVPDGLDLWVSPRLGQCGSQSRRVVVLAVEAAARIADHLGAGLSRFMVDSAHTLF